MPTKKIYHYEESAKALLFFIEENRLGQWEVKYSDWAIK